MYPKHWPNVDQIKTLFNRHFPKTCPYSLTKIIWTVSYLVPSKLKFWSCGHQITFFVNLTLIKILHIVHLSLHPTFLVSCEKCLCVESHFGHWKVSHLSPNSMNSNPNHGSTRVSAWCWKTHIVHRFVDGDGFRCWPSVPPGVVCLSVYRVGN